MKKLTIILSVILLCGFSFYGCIGTSHNVEEIKKRAPDEFAARNWKILRYEGFQYGSFSSNGGKVWYHVSNVDNPNIQYRVIVTLWNGELQYYYNAPEILNRIEIKK